MAAGGRIVATVLLAQLCAVTARADGADPKRRVAVLEYRAGSAELPGIDRRASELLEKRTSLDIVDVEEARKRYGDSLDGDVVRCAGDAGCVAKIGGKLGAREVLLVGVSEFGDVILTLQRIDVKSRAVETRIAEALAPGAQPPDDELGRYLARVMPASDFLRFGTIRIDANVAGAAVTISGHARGVTPVGALRVKAPATYDIRLSKEGFVPFRASVAVPPDAEVDVHPVLSRQGNDAWYSRWWITAIAGAVVVGSAATVGYVLLSGSPDSVPVSADLPR
jgi:PEGA domain-containing protein